MNSIMITVPRWRTRRVFFFFFKERIYLWISDSKTFLLLQMHHIHAHQNKNIHTYRQLGVDIPCIHRYKDTFFFSLCRPREQDKELFSKTKYLQSKYWILYSEFSLLCVQYFLTSGAEGIGLWNHVFQNTEINDSKCFIFMQRPVLNIWNNTTKMSRVRNELQDEISSLSVAERTLLRRNTHSRYHVWLLYILHVHINQKQHKSN